MVFYDTFTLETKTYFYMKTKSIRKALAVAFFACVLSMTSNSVFALGNGSSHNPRDDHHHHNGGSNDINAPLDGGILTILIGGAGAAYLVRKKRKNN